MAKILHTADWHIGSFNGPTVDGENGRYHDVCGSILTLINDAKEQQPDIAIIAGDLFHQAKVWSDRGLKESQFAITALRSLSTICPVVVMRGTPNHDSAEQFNALKVAFEDDDRVSIVTEPGVKTYYTGKGEPIQIACVPGFDRGYYRAKHPGLSKEEENEVFTEAIKQLIVGMKAQCKADIPTVLVGHFTITGCNMESGQTAFMAQFEPVVYPDILQEADYDLVCFGHIHRPQLLDGCKATYYSGAVAALNFNDEGQERGYYIHELDNKGNETASTFRRIPTREFKTIRLDDEDVAELNAGNLDYISETDTFNDFEQKIVRVLYNCTDENNKAFNHALLENYLYSHGAYFVQEITPQKITITVDKSKLEADDTPEDNLITYLKEKDIPDDRIGAIVELARPIISEAVERTTSEKKTGLFVPVEISVKNYRNYRNETFSYDNVNFCTINGQNGVGKSSLFMDAMIDCLYEEPREGELTGWICNDPEARSGSIMFTFKIGDRTYRVTRTRAKSGKATLNISENVDGEWNDMSAEKYRDTQKIIEDTLGMDSLTLKACALIMQDQYGLFLQADKEARMNILGNILGLGAYSTMETIAADKLTDTNREIRTLNEKADVLTAGMPDTKKLNSELDYNETVKNMMSTKITETQAEAEEVKKKLNAKTEAAERAKKLETRKNTLSGNRALKESQKASQMAIIAGADAILSQEADITAGVQKYKDLCEREKSLISIEGEYKSEQLRLSDLRKDIENSDRAINDSYRKAERIRTDLAVLKKSIENEDILAEKHAEYVQITSEIASMEEVEQLYREKAEAAQNASQKLSELKRTADKNESDLKAKISVLEQKTAMLESSGCPDIENATCRFLKDAQEAKAQLPALREALEKSQKANEETLAGASRMVEIVREELSRICYDPSLLNTLRSDLRAIEPYERKYSELESMKAQIAMVEERLKELEKTIDELETERKVAETTAAELEQSLEEKKAAVNDLSQIRAEITAAYLWTEKERQLPLAKEKKSTASERVFELISEIEAINAEIEECDSALEKERSLAQDIGALTASMKELNEIISTLTNDVQGVSVRIGGLKKQLEQADESLRQVEELQKQATELGAKAAAYETLKKAFSQDGIPHNIVRSIIPIFEATASNILGQMSGGKMSVEFVTEKVFKSNSKKEVTALDIIINDCNTGRLPYMSRSGGERVKAALSVILALSEIKSNKAGIQLGFLFIDEPPFLDSQGVQAYCDALETIQSRYSDLKIMAITHDPAMKARFPQSLDVVKTEDGSKVIY
ncbi:MAG TPA: exonuclease subunit SbcD [Ruminococcus sp.]